MKELLELQITLPVLPLIPFGLAIVFFMRYLYHKGRVAAYRDAREMFKDIYKR